MNTSKKDIYITALLSAIVFIALVIIACSNNFTGDSGDSISHYLYAHYAFKHTVLFFNHWAKPFYVLLSSPFAQFGFTGIKVFNCLLASLSMFFTILVARKLNLRFANIVIVCMLCSPLYFRLIFSGLTEYLCGLMIIVSIYLVLLKRYGFAILLISFLPFVRSEGLIILGVFAVYLVVCKKWRLLPVLLTGHIAYSLAGCFYYHDILWVFTKIPYIHSADQFGKGKLFDFVHILMYVIEKPNFILLMIGFVAFAYIITKKGIVSINYEEGILVYVGFIVFFAAHSIFWWKGLFHSGGFLMPRVLNAIVPLVALIALRGFNFVICFIKKPFYEYISVGIVVIVITVFPFIQRSKGLVFDKRLFVIPENDLIRDKVVPFIKHDFPDYLSYKTYYAHPYITLALNIDPFDSLHSGPLNEISGHEIPEKSIAIWDDWFAPIENGMQLDGLTSDKSLQLVNTFETMDNQRRVRFLVFKKAN